MIGVAAVRLSGGPTDAPFTYSSPSEGVPFANECYRREMVVALAILLACKLAWNVGAPMWLMDKRRGQGLSLHVHVELVLLVLMIVLADRPIVVAIRGISAIVASYGLAYALARWLGWKLER